MARLLSFGHSTKTFDDYVALCRIGGIDVVCDVRRFPRSRRHPHFARERLEQQLPSYGIRYVWLGEELGGFRDEGYEAWMNTEMFEQGLRALEEIAATALPGFMCSEGRPEKCHRSFVARALVSRGHEVSHLLPDGTTVREEPLPSTLDL